MSQDPEDTQEELASPEQHYKVHSYGQTITNTVSIELSPLAKVDDNYSARISALNGVSPVSPVSMEQNGVDLLQEESRGNELKQPRPPSREGVASGRDLSKMAAAPPPPPSMQHKENHRNSKTVTAPAGVGEDEFVVEEGDTDDGGDTDEPNDELMDADGFALPTNGDARDAGDIVTAGGPADDQEDSVDAIINKYDPADDDEFAD